MILIVIGCGCGRIAFDPQIAATDTGAARCDPTKPYGPLSPLFRIPILALVSEVVDKAVVVDGEIVARPILTVTATMDHRYLDGAHAARQSAGIVRTIPQTSNSLRP